MTDSNKVLVTIDNEVYDLTAFKEIHPGGRLIIEQYHDKDATEAFWAFHGKEGHEKLKNMKGVPIKKPISLNPRIKNFRDLRQKFENEGFFQTNYLWQFYKCISSCLLFVVGLMLTASGHWFLGSILFGIGYQQMGWLGHDACHHGLTPNRKFNNMLGLIFGNFINGFSVNWWKDRHNTHHAITNVMDADPDVDNLPLFVWSELDFPKIPIWPSLAKKIIPYQHYYFVPWTVTLKLIWALQSFFFLKNKESQNKSYLKSLPAEKFTIFMHYVAVFFVLRMTPSFGAAVLFFLISEFIGGAGIALIVFMNHYPLEQIDKDQGRETDFLGLQLLGTKNIEPSIFMDWFAGGLNYQVEHHLFPTIPRHNLSKVKPHVEQFCKENDLPYVSQSYYDCISSVLSKLQSIAQQYTRIMGKINKKG